jgi:hypothetical protein
MDAMTGAGMAKRRVTALFLCAVIFSGVACSTPHVQPPADMSLFGRSEIGFIRGGETTREEILLALGQPATRFENDRILIYHVGFERNGRVHLYAPRIIEGFGLQDWEPETYSLVLVFRPDGVLNRFSLIGSQ